MKRLMLGLIGAAVMAAMAGAAYAERSVTITLREAAEVKGEAVLIGDVARVRAAMPEVVKLVAAVRVAAAPDIEKSTRVTADEVRAGLAKLPLDMSAIAIGGAPSVVVSRSGQVIRPGALQAAVRSHVLEHLGLPADDVVCEMVRVPRAFAVAAGAVTYSVVPIGDKPYAGYQTFSVGLRVDGAEVRTERVSVKIRLFRPVAVARRRLGRDELIQDEDVTLERREVTSSVGSYYVRSGDVVGKRATRSVSAGVVLTDVMVGEPLAVRRNDYVTLVARRGRVRVRTKCVVLKDASVGERVDVMNQDSKKVIRARVVGPNLVELNL